MSHICVFLIVALILGAICIILDRVVTPWEIRKKFEKFQEDLREGKIKPRRFEKRICFDNNGVFIQFEKSGEKSPCILWSEITKVLAFKRDQFTVDQICVFLTKADDTGLECDEDSNNWENFIKSLPAYLPTCKSMESWHREVMLPPFETKMTELYCRHPAAQSCQAGGLPEISRGLSVATPPENRKTPTTPEGWQKPKS